LDGNVGQHNELLDSSWREWKFEGKKVSTVLAKLFRTTYEDIYSNVVPVPPVLTKRLFSLVGKTYRYLLRV
jgi:hypothetical protein